MTRWYTGFSVHAGSLKRQSFGAGAADDRPAAIFAVSTPTRTPRRGNPRALTAVFTAAPASSRAVGMPIASAPSTASTAASVIIPSNRLAIRTPSTQWGRCGDFVDILPDTGLERPTSPG